jgi:hypothetical protein
MQSVRDTYDNVIKSQLCSAVDKMRMENDQHYLLLSFYLRDSQSNYRIYASKRIGTIDLSDRPVMHTIRLFLKLVSTHNVIFDDLNYSRWVYMLLKRFTSANMDLYNDFINSQGKRPLMSIHSVTRNDEDAVYKSFPPHKQNLLISNHNRITNDMNNYYTVYAPHEKRQEFLLSWPTLTRAKQHEFLRILVEKNDTQWFQLIHDNKSPSYKTALIIKTMVAHIMILGNTDMLDKLQSLGYDLGLNCHLIMKACASSNKPVIAWWLRHKEINFEYQHELFDYMSIKGFHDLMSTWIDSCRPIIYSSNAFDSIPIHQNDLLTIQWWFDHKQSLSLKATDLFLNNAIIHKKIYMTDWYYTYLARKAFTSIPITSESSSDVCAICMADSSVIPYVKTHCNHLFHETCLKRHLDLKQNCPICRQEIVVNLDFK